MLYEIDGKAPRLAASSWAAPNATLVGDVVLEDEASVWWGAVLRAEAEPILIGEGSNVQDNAVLHVDPGFPLTMGKNVTIGHLAMVHGCTIGDGTLVGIGATILNGAKIGRNCLIGAHALIGEGKVIPDGSVVMGMPGKIMREVKEEDLARLAGPALVYRERAKQYARGLKTVG